MWTLILIGALIFLLLILFYKWATKNNNFFDDKNVKFIKPLFLIGNSSDLLLKKISLAESVQDWYNKFPNEKIYGMWSFRTPFFLIRDPELTKLFCIKEFDSFSDHLSTMTEEMDPLLGNALLSLQGKKWKNMRATLSPAFTGSKMRQMFTLVDQYTSNVVKSLNNDINSDAGKDVLEMKDLFAKFTVDIIATCTFGLEIDSYKHPENDFKKIANKTMNPSVFFMIIKMLLLQIIPKVMKKFDISLLDRHTKNFFRQTINGTMKYREEKNIIRPDMINLLMQAKKGKLKHEEESSDEKEKINEVFNWTDDEIVAQCLLFFLAGFDTSATFLGFAAYELAVNPEIQEKLRKEILDMKETLNGKDLNYDAINSMKYLNRFVMEVLRKWPPGIAVERISSKDFTFELDGKSINIPQKYGLLFTIYAFHHEAKNFPDPEKFDPDRFDDENIVNQNMNAYMPFGLGPRSCIGNRFALMNVKTVIYKMLLNFSFEVTEKTQIPLQYKKTMVNVVTEKGIWIKLKPLDVSDTKI